MLYPADATDLPGKRDGGPRAGQKGQRLASITVEDARPAERDSADQPQGRAAFGDQQGLDPGRFGT